MSVAMAIRLHLFVPSFSSILAIVSLHQFCTLLLLPTFVIVVESHWRYLYFRVTDIWSELHCLSTFPSLFVQYGFPSIGSILWRKSYSFQSLPSNSCTFFPLFSLLCYEVLSIVLS